MLHRPEYHIERLSIESRWEATRRHPVYLQVWQIYQTVQNSEDPRPWSTLSREIVFMNACAALQIFGVPIDPTTDFSDLDAPSISPNAFEPITIRHIFGILASSLSPETLREIATAYNAIADGHHRRATPGEALEALEAMSGILHSNTDELLRYLDAPFFRVSPVAPRETWTAEMVEIQRTWRERLNLSAHRDRSSRHSQYFQAWDLREGWEARGYDRSAARSLRDVATELGKPTSTVQNWYQRAFHLISGHEFTPEKWFELMGVQQLSELFAPNVHLASLRRETRERTPREIDTSTVVPGRSELNRRETTEDRHQFEQLDGVQLATRVSALIADGRSDSEILGALDLSDIVLPAVQHLRERDDLAAN